MAARTALRLRLHHRALPAVFELTTYALASRLRASWMEARVTKVARVSARFSKSLARCRFPPNQENCARPPKRRGSTTKPFLSSLRLTTATRRAASLPPQCRPARRCGPHRPDRFEPREAPAEFVEDQAAAVAILDRGGVDNDPHRQPLAVNQGEDFSPPQREGPGVLCTNGEPDVRDCLIDN